MPINATCPQCDKTFSIRAELAGKAVRCSCGQKIQIPASDHSPMPASKCKPAAAVSPGGAATSSAPGRPSLRLVLVGCCGVAALLLVVGTIVGLMVYASVKSAKPAESKETEVASKTVPAERGKPENAPAAEPNRLVDIDDAPPQTPQTPSDKLTPKEPPKDAPPAVTPSDKPAPKEPPKDAPSAIDDTPPQTPSDKPAPKDAPPAVLSKSLATMDRLTIAIAPSTPDDKPPPEVWDGHTASIRGVAFTDDGRFVVSVSGAIQKVGMKTDNSIRVWDAHRGKQVHKLDGFREALDAVSVSPGGRFAVFGHGGHYEGRKWIDSLDHRVHLWDIQDNREVYFRKGIDGGEDAASDKAEARFEGLDSSVFSTAFSLDRKRVAGVANSGRLALWATQRGEALVQGKVAALARPRTDPNTLRKISFTLSGINCIRFTPDGRWLLLGGGDYTVRLLDASTGEQLHSFESHQDIVWSVAVTRTKDGRLLGLSGGGQRQALRQGGFVPGARDYAIRLWDLAARKEIRRFVGHEGSVQSLTFCPNGRHFLSAGADKTVRLWDIDRGTLLRTYRGHREFIRSVAVSPDGRVAVSGGDDCKIRYWRLPANVDDLVAALKKKDRAKVTQAMADIETMGPELRNAYPQLVQALHLKDETIASLALSALRRIGQPNKECVNDLRELLIGPVLAVRLFAAEALARLGADALPALAELRKALADTDSGVRRHAVVALGNLGKDAAEAADDLGQRVQQETEDEIKTEAVHALGKIGDKKKLKALFRDMKEPVLLVAIMDALAVAGIDRGMVDPLTSKGLRHADAAVRSKALDSLQRLGLDTLSIKTLAALNVEDASPEVRKRAAKVLSERMDQLSDADMKDILALLGMADKPKAFQIGLQAVKHLGPKAAQALPELLKLLPAAKGKDKVEMALAVAAIDAKNKKIVEAVGPVLVAALRPKTKDDKPSEEVLKSIAAIGEPVVDEIFKGIEAAEGRGVLNANNRKALFVALQRLGRDAYSEGNVQSIRRYQRSELYRDVREEAQKAIGAMLPP